MVKKYFEKYKKSISYVVAGVATTAVNYAVYLFFVRLLKTDEIAGNIISWIASVIFAYFVNKIFVFKSKSTNIATEFAKFVLLRLVSGVADTALFAWMVKSLLWNDIVAKTITQVLVIISNYLFSNIYIFK